MNPGQRLVQADGAARCCSRYPGRADGKVGGMKYISAVTDQERRADRGRSAGALPPARRKTIVAIKGAALSNRIVDGS